MKRKYFINILLLFLLCTLDITSYAGEQANYGSKGSTSFYGTYKFTDSKEKEDKIDKQGRHYLLPKTGDSSNTAVFIHLLIFTLIVFIISTFRSKKKKIQITVLLITTIMAGILSTFGTLAAEETSKSEFSLSGDDTSITKPLDPLLPNPMEPVVPKDDVTNNVKPGTSGPLSIDFASSMQFGEQNITTKTQRFYAKLQRYTTYEGTETSGPNYIQVTDKRGTLAGWKLTVTQESQFKTADNTELAGASLGFLNGQICSNIEESYAPNIVQSSVSLTPAVSSLLVISQSGQGMGTWIYRLGDEGTADKSVYLEVPGGISKKVEAYNSDLRWTLVAGP